MSEPGRRAGEAAVAFPTAIDAGLVFIGRIRTPWTEVAQCPKQPKADGPECRVEVDPRWIDALDGIEGTEFVQILYWMHLSRRDLTIQRPRGGDRLVGTFALRSPVRPNPVASSTVPLIGRHGNVLTVRGLDCVDGTPLIDIKPDRCPMWGSQARR